VTDTATKVEAATTYNNFYEFGVTRTIRPARPQLAPRPWTVQVDGFVHKPKTFDIDELLKLFPLEERVYSLRCVEAWSMVIPWIGFPLAVAAQARRADGQAKYVEFTTLLDPSSSRAEAGFFGFASLDWPYVEGCGWTRRCTAHPADRGHVRQGAAQSERRADPHRRAVEVRLQERQVDRADPPGRRAAQDRLGEGGALEYGFYSNVNPAVSHPRWSQADERRSASSAQRRRCRSTATPIRWRRSTPGWT
jgi:sulfoxide reductase catalytic subunit YedY